MPARSKSFELWGKGLEHWEAGRLDDAAAAFREAITHGRNDVNFTEYLKSLGGVLGHLGRYNEAQAALEQALEQALDESRAEGNGSSNVVSARHSLAEHFLLVLRPMEAIAVTAPSIGIGAKLEGILRYVRAFAFDALGDSAKARSEAVAALELASSDDQRERMRTQLARILQRHD
ncbi:MAG: hypothetical protein DMF59_01210 [Acidobacteria bacterium]|nr:MAG: hypothetical protein DMF59_01210 [Acidobacteriota bacterium]